MFVFVWHMFYFILYLKQNNFFGSPSPNGQFDATDLYRSVKSGVTGTYNIWEWPSRHRSIAYQTLSSSVRQRWWWTSLLHNTIWDRTFNTCITIRSWTVQGCNGGGLEPFIQFGCRNHFRWTHFFQHFFHFLLVGIHPNAGVFLIITACRLIDIMIDEVLM